MANKGRELKPHDQRPWPKRGDGDIKLTYAAVGRAISEWERYEWLLSHAFSSMVAGLEHQPARRAYCAVRTFEARADMLRAASTTHFSESPNDDLQKSFKRILSNSVNFSQRRNEIAHGVVDSFNIYDDYGALIRQDTFALYPSFAAFKGRDARTNKPDYCYSSIEIEYFSNEFRKMMKPILDFIALFERALGRT